MATSTLLLVEGVNLDIVSPYLFFFSPLLSDWHSISHAEDIFCQEFICCRHGTSDFAFRPRHLFISFSSFCLVLLCLLVYLLFI